MKSLLATCGAVLCVAMTACAAVQEPESGDNPATMSVDSSEGVTVPPDLSFDTLKGNGAGNERANVDNSCHVDLLTCPVQGRNPTAATFCSRGQCDAGEAVDLAISACKQVCHPQGQCNQIAFVGKCSDL